MNKLEDLVSKALFPSGFILSCFVNSYFKVSSKLQLAFSILSLHSHDRVLFKIPAKKLHMRKILTAFCHTQSLQNSVVTVSYMLFRVSIITYTNVLVRMIIRWQFLLDDRGWYNIIIQGNQCASYIDLELYPCPSFYPHNQHLLANNTSDTSLITTYLPTLWIRQHPPPPLIWLTCPLAITPH